METRLRLLILAGVALLLVWVLAGCGSDEPLSPGGSDGTVVSTQADGQARVLIAFKQKPGRQEGDLVRGLGGKIKCTYRLVPAMAASVPGHAVKALRANRHVARVEPDGIIKATQESLPWGVNRIDAELVHAADNTGAGTNVAVIDTGMDYTHPDLDANYRGGYDFVNADADPMDDNGHGTHCAGVVAAERNGMGVVGVAPGASLYILKVLDASGSGHYSDLIAALEWCADPANGIQVVSMSLSGTSDSTVLQAACNNAYGAGVLLVAAAGNSGNPPGKGDSVEYPAKYDSVIAVGATDINDRRPRWSSTGPALELAAPGVSIHTTYVGGGYATFDGTSAACPHVSGTAALAIASGVVGAQAVRERLCLTADDLGPAGVDPKYGYGLVDADEAAGIQPPPPPPGKMHVAAIDMSARSRGPWTNAEARVTIVDATGSPVAAATVSGYWSGLTTNADSGTTDSDGVAALQSDKTRAPSGTFTFTVSDVAKAGWTYHAAANIETSDSVSIP